MSGCLKRRSRVVWHNREGLNADVKSQKMTLRSLLLSLALHFCHGSHFRKEFDDVRNGDVGKKKGTLNDK